MQKEDTDGQCTTGTTCWMLSPLMLTPPSLYYSLITWGVWLIQDSCSSRSWPKSLTSHTVWGATPQLIDAVIRCGWSFKTQPSTNHRSVSQGQGKRKMCLIWLSEGWWGIESQQLVQWYQNSSWCNTLTNGQKCWTRIVQTKQFCWD